MHLLVAVEVYQRQVVGCVRSTLRLRPQVVRVELFPIVERHAAQATHVLLCLRQFLLFL